MADQFSFDKIINELIHVYGDQELWLVPGVTLHEPFEVVRCRRAWRSAKIVKRNGTIVAEQTENPDSWMLMGNYQTPFQGTCTAPYDAHLRGYFYQC